LKIKGKSLFFPPGRKKKRGKREVPLTEGGKTTKNQEKERTHSPSSGEREKEMHAAFSPSERRR